MGRILVAAVFLWANLALPAMAATCASLGGANLPAYSASGASIYSVLYNGTGGIYTCYRSGRFTYRDNNESLTSASGTTVPISGSFLENHNGGSSVVNPEGTYVISSPGAGAEISYTYNTGGGTYTYHVCNNPTGNAYTFITVSGPGVTANTALTIYVTNGVGTC